MKRPILLWMTSRSRSSLVAKIFQEHGLWLGDPGPDGKISSGGSYLSYENDYLKSLQKRYTNNILPVMKETISSTQFEREVVSHVGTKNCCFKTGIEHFNMWKSFTPYNIFIRRPVEEVVNSLKQKRPDTDIKYATKVTKWRYNYMDECKRTYGGVDVNTGKILEEDYSEIYEALVYCDIEPIESLVQKAIS
jgi:hypothetical protein